MPRISRIVKVLATASFAVAAPSLSLPSFASDPTVQTDPQGGAIQEALAHPSAPLSGYNLNLNALRGFYASRNNLPAWSEGSAEERNANAAIAILESAQTEGLDPDAYRLDAIRARQKLSSPGARAEFDLLLTAGMLSYLHDLRIGRVAQSDVGRDIELPPIAFDAAAELSRVLADGTLDREVAALEPPHQEYANLKVALARYRDMQSKGGWPLVDVSPSLKLDADDARLADLRRRLAAEDGAVSLERGTDPAGELAQAIVRYQAHNGLEETGTVGKATLAALNVPVDRRIGQIIANMERWRWLPRPFEQTYIEVNTADATLKVVDHGAIILTSRIIAGKLATPTPIFSTTVTALTVNPYWNIPSVIARNEILPKERRHPGYMAAQHIFADGPDGSLRQKPGPDNALGYLKLEMPNRFNAYLHDTPSRSLFARNDRHFSHGCMRVQQIWPLASWALSGSTDSAIDKIKAAVASGSNQRISLDRPLSVYVLYWTVIADQGGSVEFRPDVYGRDTKLLAALAGQRLTGRLSLNTNCQAGVAG